MSEKLINPTPQGNEPAQEPKQEPAQQEASWYWDDNTPGQGERPEWLKSKYSKVTDQAKAYIEAEKYIGKSSAPESYNLEEFKDYIDLENEKIAELTNNAKQHRLSEESLKAVLEPLKNYHKSLAPDINKELEKLGEHAKTRIDTVNSWASNNLSDKAIEAMGKLPETAEVVELLDEIRQLHVKSSRVPNGNEAPVPDKSMVTAEQVQEEIKNNYARYRTDYTYRQQLQDKLKLALGEE